MDKTVLRQPGFWLGWGLVGFLVYNDLRAWLAPAGFAAGFGVTGPGATSPFVTVYALRTGLLAAALALLLLGRQWRSLAIVTFLGALVALGDAALTYQTAGWIAHHAVHFGAAAVLALASGLFMAMDRTLSPSGRARRPGPDTRP